METTIFGNLKATPWRPTAKDYVQDGIARHWDGECNNGYTNAHSSSITYWNENITGVHTELISGRYSWNNNNLNVTAQQNDCFQYKDLVNTGDWTYEVCFTDGDNNGSVMYCGGANIYIQPSRLRYQNDSGSWVDAEISPYASSGTLAISVGNGSIKLYVNGVLKYTGEFTRTIAATTNGYIYGTRKYHRIMMYDSAVSDSVLAYNYEVDKARFGL